MSDKVRLADARLAVDARDGAWREARAFFSSFFDAL
jgi:hypothetical protein